MLSSTPPPVRRRRSATALGALAVSGALLLSPALTSASATAAVDTPVNESSANTAVNASGSQLALSATAFTAGDEITVDYTTDQAHELNWVGLYRAGQQPGDGASTLWDYAGDAQGKVSFTLDLPAGEYDIWFLATDGYDALAGPYTITVAADPTKPQPGDPSAAVEIDPVATSIETDGVIVREGFQTESAPEGWSVDSDAADSAAYGAWTFTTRADWTRTIDEMRGRFARPLDTLAVADAQQSGGALDTTLTSAPVAVDGLASVRLSFDSHYRGAAGQTGVVRVSFDGGESTEILRLDSESVTDGYDARQMNYAQDIVVDVPDDAGSAVFSWEFTAEAGARYWAIDSVAVHQVQKAADAAPTQAWIMSDIQGHPGDLQHALGDYSQIAPDADAMLMVGDIVNSGTDGEWQEIYDVMDATDEIRPRQTIAANGNHERYAPGGFDANMERFFAFAERDQQWAEYVVEGPAGDLPVLVIGQEFASPSDVAMSDAQVEFLEERLAHWTALDTQVVVMTHFPLGDTVSASWIPGYHGHHQMNDRLTSILGNYPNAIIFTGHTHYPAELGDWAVQRRTGDGHPDGFWAINTIAMHIEWDAFGENTQGIEEKTTRDINQGLTLDYYGDRVVVTAYDFATDEQIRQVEIANPLVAFDADVRPGAPDPDPETPDPGTPDPGTPDPGTPDPGTPEGPGEGDDGAEAGDGSAADDDDLATTGGELPWGIVLAAVGLIAGGLGLALRLRRRT
ncbi:MAG TPA: hypothetical protein DIW46_09170 [Microbacterium sp.]|nr:hypothetical protein [Microbacterium sp.]